MTHSGRFSIVFGSLIVMLILLIFGQFQVAGQADQLTPTPSLTPAEITQTPIPGESPNPPGVFDDTEPTPTGSSSPPPSSTGTPSLTPSLTETPSQTTQPFLSFPLIIRQPTVTPTLTPTIAPVERFLVCRSPNVVIPDNNSGGVSDTLQINDGRWIQDLDIRLDVSHTFTSDLVANLTHIDTGTTINLLNRPGEGCTRDHVKAILDDDASLQANSQCNPNVNFPYPPTIGGMFRPVQALSNLNGLPAGGNGWRLTFNRPGSRRYGHTALLVHLHPGRQSIGAHTYSPAAGPALPGACERHYHFHAKISLRL